MGEYTYGKHVIITLLSGQANKVQQLFVLKTSKDSRLAEIIDLAEKNQIPVKYLDRQTLNELVNSDKHQGVVAVVNSNREHDLNSLIAQSSNPFLLILDGIQDPHNLGACLRSAQAAGVDAVIVPKDNAVGLTPAVRKVACGAAELIPFIQVTNLARTLQALQKQGVWIYGFDADTEHNIYTADFKRPMALVMGAEEKGLRQLTKKYCDVLLKIPMPGDMESLNVSVATGIGLFEVVRQRG